MAATVAQTKKAVDNMSARDRLWDSLGYTYGLKREDSDKQFRQAYSQADRAALQRGMGRSSYNLSTLAGIDRQRIDAGNAIWSEQIADYENRLQQIEDAEREQANWEKQYAENQRQFNENLAFNRERANVSDTQWQKQYDYQVGRDTVADQQWQKQYDYQLGRDKVADQQWNLTYNYQKERDAVADKQYQQNYNYQVSRDQVADQQWAQAFDYQAQRDARADYQWGEEFRVQQEQADRELAASYAQALLAAGLEVPNSLLKQAGLSIINGQLVNTGNTASSGSSGGYSGSYSGGKKDTSKDSTTNDTKDTTSTTDEEYEAILRDVYGDVGKYVSPIYKDGRVVNSMTNSNRNTKNRMGYGTLG